MKQLVFLTFFLTLLSSCNKSSNENTYTTFFSREDFIQKDTLHFSEKINIKEVLNPFYIYLVKDSLALISYRDVVQPYKAGLYSLKSGKLIREIAPKGEGPQEFISCTLDVRDNNSDIFYIEDVVQNKYWICSIDSIISGAPYLLQSFTYSRDAIRLCPLEQEKEYIGYNFWYLNNEEYNNQVTLLNKYKMEKGPKGRLASGHEYFVANVTGGYVFANNNHTRFWVSDFFTDNIHIFNDSLQLIKCLNGPDHIKPEYKEIQEEQKYIFFQKGTSYRAYLAYTLTPQHIYLAYEGTNGTPYKTTDLKPIEVFKLDWDGNLLACYQLDKHAFTISVDSQENFLYACCYNSYEGEIEFLKYKLK